MATATMAYLTVVALSIAAVAAAPTPPAATKYINHTVGGDAGWFFNATTNTSSTNYSSWAATQSFNLGDFLLFNTNMDQTVIQTYNETTYNSCSVDDALDSDTFQYNGGSNQVGTATIPVPLTMEGANFFFSSASEGVQCQQGMAFEIAVSRGLGLPPSLNQPPPPPYVAPPTPSDDQSPHVIEDPAGGGVRTGANLRWAVSALLFGSGFLFVLR